MRFSRGAPDLLWQQRRSYSDMRQEPNLKTLSDAELRRRLSEFLRQSRHAEADLIAHLGEFDTRRLYLREAAPSMFAWCTEVLHHSEHEAYLRITVARASREHPILLAMLRDGRLHLSGICKLAPHLTRDNRTGLLKRAEHKSKRQIEELVASLVPRPPAPAAVRKLLDRRDGRLPASTLEQDSGGSGTSRGAASSARAEVPGSGSGLNGAPARLGERGPDGVALASAELGPDRVPARLAAPRPAVVEPVAPARFRIRFDASAELRDKLERLRALMRSSVPDGDLAKIIEEAVTEKLARLESRRFGKTKAPRKRLADTSTAPTSRHIPAAVRRAVYARDGGRCMYRDTRGRRCSARHDLEFHHHGQPFGRGGDHSLGNIRLMCRAHNALLAQQDYGRAKVARHRRTQPAGGRIIAGNSRREVASPRQQASPP